MGVIGGGAGGLFTARLLALRHPTWQIEVFERLESRGTFGFGIGLTGAALAAVESVDPEAREAIAAVAFRFATAEFRLPGGTVGIPGFHRGVAIARSQLLTTLVDLARQVGVRVHVGHDVDVDDVRRDFDLVVAADGVSSSTRQRYQDAFEPTVVEGRGRYIWCGTEAPLDGTVFTPVRTPAGYFTAHAYPYAPDRSTIVVETDAATLERAGLDGFEARGADPAESDEESLDVLTEAFAPMLRGHKLLGNRSRWFRFRTVQCRSWVHGNAVLLGDAAATADPSLGSGTKLAVESAIALADALDTDAPLDEALSAYESARRPPVERLQGWALRSQRWWDSFPRRMNRLAPAQVAVAFLTRAGAVALDETLESNADVVRAAVAAWAGVGIDGVPHRRIADWVVGRPLRVGDRQAPSRLIDLARRRPEDGLRFGGPVTVTSGDPWGPESDRLVDAAREIVRDGPDRVVLLRGAEDRQAVLDRVQVAERIRLDLDVPVGVTVGESDVQDVAGALVAGRIDVACLGAVPATTTPSGERGAW
ncbi:anthraniloyl-CoA monooxygenase [Pseudonocardia endophytica]|uniref:Anthraniloyl-CoA monooxygenase n=1 Tax=Pseudonocardia endophytica TaxID=401976 RepID=A0A4R1HID2_PSEEN|nr:anthraniloyl-CoA monooxygenase [Pseudonocardia endophytica]